MCRYRLIFFLQIGFTWPTLLLVILSGFDAVSTKNPSFETPWGHFKLTGFESSLNIIHRTFL